MKLNKSEFKWFLILIGFTCYIYSLLSTGKIELFVHPKMIKYIWFSFIIFLILAIYQISIIFKTTTNKKGKVSFIVFLIPLVLGICVNPLGLNSETGVEKGITIIQTDNNKKKSATLKNVTNTSDAENNSLVIDGGNFTHFIDDVTYTNPAKYKGKIVTITGFVFTDVEVPKNQFLIARLMMVCCAADTEATGILCDWSKFSTLKIYSWVTVTGVIDTENVIIDGQSTVVPVIKVQAVKAAQKPKNQYIYPE